MDAISGSSSLWGAELRAWRTGVVLDVVDRSLEASRVAREQAKVEQAKREAERQREEARSQEMRRQHEEIEAEDARRLAELHRQQADDARREQLLQGD
jgi:hypothetical protein